MYQYFPAPVALLAIAAASPAAAQDAPDVTPFTGPRIEATVGLDQLRFDLATIGGSGREKANDLGYGVAAGYDVAVSPSLLAGVEVGAKLSDIDYTTGTAITGGSLRARRELTVAGRLGTAITPNTLLYGKVGYANLQVREDQIAAGVTGSRLRDLDGLLLGAGAEVKVSPNAYLKSEYRYTDYAGGHVGNTIMTGVGVRF